MDWNQLVEELQSKGFPVRKGYYNFLDRIFNWPVREIDWMGNLGNTNFIVTIGESNCFLRFESNISTLNLVNALREILKFPYTVSLVDLGKGHFKYVTLLARSEHEMEFFLEWSIKKDNHILSKI